ncbi:hypothetical protein CFP75_43095 [Amycolatopsis alba DSM 44262]|uniref:Uncharacterized protein n=2 Tax=Amycolatopsis alba TaxID=76020 RepID=A0A229R6W1_AMYAL|nr:hypothetical protein CFP75_43095 [Amycolatopsis alba DSM 44262]
MRGGVARVHWPSGQHAAAPLVLWFAPGGAGAERVAGCGAVVIAAGVPAFPAARAVLEWAAAHPRSLGAGSGPVLVAGEGPGAELAARVAKYAKEQGWPPVREVDGGPRGIAAHLEQAKRIVEE